MVLGTLDALGAPERVKGGVWHSGGRGSGSRHVLARQLGATMFVPPVRLRHGTGFEMARLRIIPRWVVDRQLAGYEMCSGSRRRSGGMLGVIDWLANEQVGA